MNTNTFANTHVRTVEEDEKDNHQMVGKEKEQKKRVYDQDLVEK